MALLRMALAGRMTLRERREHRQTGTGQLVIVLKITHLLQQRQDSGCQPVTQIERVQPNPQRQSLCASPMGANGVEDLKKQRP